MTTHAPGPWSAHTNGTDWFVTARDFRGAECRIGKVYVMDLEYHPDKDGVSLTEGNARLAAAAPDMLAALKEALRHLRNLQPMDDSQAVPKAFALSAVANGLLAAGIRNLSDV